MNRNIFSYLPAICWLMLIIVLLTLPGSAIPKENWLDKIWADKWIHIGLFAILVALWYRAVSKTVVERSTLKKYFIIIAVLGIAFGAGMEFVQKYWVNNRSFDVGDIIADSIGSLLGLAFSLSSYIKK